MRYYSPVRSKFPPLFGALSSAAIYLVPLHDIDWIQADGDYLRIHTAARPHLARLTMKEVERQLDPSRFLRLHRSTIVNLDRVERFCLAVRAQKVVAMRDGERLKPSATARGMIRELSGRN